MNSVNIIGRLTADVEIRTTNSGKEVASFSIAVNKPAKQGEERQAEFFDCVAWGQTALFIQRYFNKGKMIAINGRLSQRRWEKDGKKYSAVEIVVNDVSFCGDATPSENKAENGAGFDNTPDYNNFFDDTAADNYDDGLPF